MPLHLFVENQYQPLGNLRISLNKNSLVCLSYTFPSEREQEGEGERSLFIPQIFTHLFSAWWIATQPLSPLSSFISLSFLSSSFHPSFISLFSFAPFITTSLPSPYSVYQSDSHNSSMCSSPYCFMSCISLSHFLQLSIRLPPWTRSLAFSFWRLRHCHVRLSPLHLSSSRQIISHCQDLTENIFTRDISFILSFIPCVFVSRPA